MNAKFLTLGFITEHPNSPQSVIVARVVELATDSVHRRASSAGSGRLHHRLCGRCRQRQRGGSLKFQPTTVTVRARDIRAAYFSTDEEFSASCPYRLTLVLRGREPSIVLEFKRSGPAVAAHELVKTVMADAARSRNHPAVITLSNDDAAETAVNVGRGTKWVLADNPPAHDSGTDDECDDQLEATP